MEPCYYGKILRVLKKLMCLGIIARVEAFFSGYL